MKTTSICLLLVLATLLPCGYGIKCYLGVGDQTKVVSCPGSCSKVEVSYDDMAVPTYGCSTEGNDEGCSEASLLVKTTTCYCNTDYCNTAPLISAISLPLLFLSYLLHQLF